jgi:hypothetical protein
MASKSFLFCEDYIRGQSPKLEMNGFKGSVKGDLIKKE